MRLSQFLFLVELKKHGSFSRVAEELLISQPSISRAIAELEEELGYPIVKRNKKGIRFTDQGELVLQNATIIMEKISTIKQLQANEEYFKGIVTVGASPFWGDIIVADALINIQKNYPNLCIKLKEESTDSIIKYVASGRFDIGVIMSYDSDETSIFNEINKNELDYGNLFCDEVSLFTGPNHPLCEKRNIKVTDILQYPYATSSDKIATNFTLKFFRKYGYDKEIIEISNRNSLRKFVMMSNSFTAMPKKLFYLSESFKDSLVYLVLPNFRWNCKIGWIRRHERVPIVEKKIIEALALQCEQFR